MNGGPSQSARTLIAADRDARGLGFRRPDTIRDTFEAWHESGRPIDVSDAETLEEATAIAAPETGHKSRFIIQHNRKDARRFLHHFYVSKSSKKGHWRESLDGGPRVFEGNLEWKAELVMQISAPFRPVAPWQWSESDPAGSRHGICADLVNHDFGVIEQ